MQNKRDADLSDLNVSQEQSESLDALWTCISKKEQDAELAKEFMRMIIAAPGLVTEKDRQSMSKRDLGLVIVGAALHRGGLGSDSSTGRSAEALETSFMSGMGGAIMGSRRHNAAPKPGVSTSPKFFFS